MSVTTSSFEVTFRNLDICNRSADDSVIADRIKEVCPANTYSWILVRSMDHHFSVVPGDVAAASRMIEFQPTSCEAAWNLLRIIFQQTNIDTLNLNRVALGALGSPDQKDKDACRSAYWQNYPILIYVAMDPSADGLHNFDIMPPKQGAVTQKVVGFCTLL